MKYEELSTEQQQFIQYAMGGHNILVDACIGSGKTMAIQTLCTYARAKRVLYLTYNKLLKLDAQDRIRNGMVTVTNYHGFCWSELARAGVRCGLSELIQTYNQVRPSCLPYDVLILDEYQDIEQEIAEMLEHVKGCCPGIQIIAVGDMSQKIYDKTRLDVQSFITSFLGQYIPMEFTHCFRIGKEHAAMLGRVWNKDIVGVNQDFTIQYMHRYEARRLAAGLEPSQLLVLGSKNGKAQEFQNDLETYYPERFNKHTLWSKIKEGDGATSPTPDCAVFTTYDGCKGMEREVCILFDWSTEYWDTRLNKPDTKYEIIRNIFCVAASRAKRLLVVIQNDSMLEELDLMEPSCLEVPYADMSVSDMFDYKYVEDVEAAYQDLEVTEIRPEGAPIMVPGNDALIDLSPCIGHYQEAMYFTGYDLDRDIEYQLEQPGKSHLRRAYQKYTLDQKLLYLAALETKQLRYMNQVKTLPITEENRRRIRERLQGVLPPDAGVQKRCRMEFWDGEERLFVVNGVLDVEWERCVYELKFVSALSHTHILQLGMYLACTGFETGRIWNVRTDQMLEVRVPDRERFLCHVAAAITKSRLYRQECPKEVCIRLFYQYHQELCRRLGAELQERKTWSKSWLEQWFKGHGIKMPDGPALLLSYIKQDMGQAAEGGERDGKETDR